LVIGVGGPFEDGFEKQIREENEKEME